jgi:import receptor subunit TOM20
MSVFKNLFYSDAAVHALGYCIYFDRKRRSHPDFRRKLREKRKSAARSGAGSSGPTLPDFSDQEAVQRFFLQVKCS